MVQIPSTLIILWSWDASLSQKVTHSVSKGSSESPQGEVPGHGEAQSGVIKGCRYGDTIGVEHLLEHKDSIYNFITIAKIYGELNMCQENIPSTFHMLSHCILTTTLHYPYSRKPCVETVTPRG